MATDDAIISLMRCLWPALSGQVVSDPALTAWLPWCRAQAAAEPWGAYHDTALAHLLAHTVYAFGPLRESPNGAAGPVSGVSTLQMSVQYATPTPTTEQAAGVLLMTTPPGQAYIQLRASRATISAPFMV